MSLRGPAPGVVGILKVNVNLNRTIPEFTWLQGGPLCHVVEGHVLEGLLEVVKEESNRLSAHAQSEIVQLVPRRSHRT